MTGDRFRELIVEAASPESLCSNPFRVLELPTDVSVQVLRREARRLELQSRLSDGPNEDAYRLEQALRRLRDPASRLVDELLWHRPTDAAGADIHNAAVDALVAFAERDDRTAIAASGHTANLMNRSLDAPSTKEHLAQRVETLDDPRVRTSDIGDLLDAVRLLVPVLALRKAIRVYQGDHPGLALALMDMVHRQHGTAAGEAAGNVLAPIFERLRTAIGAAAAETLPTPATAVDRARRLVNETRPDRQVVDLVLVANDPRRIGVVDQLVELGRRCAIATFLETEGSTEVVPFLRTLRQLRPGPATLSQLDETIDQIEKQPRRFPPPPNQTAPAPEISEATAHAEPSADTDAVAPTLLPAVPTPTPALPRSAPADTSTSNGTVVPTETSIPDQTSGPTETSIPAETVVPNGSSGSSETSSPGEGRGGAKRVVAAATRPSVTTRPFTKPRRGRRRRMALVRAAPARPGKQWGRDWTDVWFQRCFAFIVDYLLLVVAGGLGGPQAWIPVLVLDVVVLQGLTGYTVGKVLARGIRAIAKSDGGPPGLVRAALRALPWIVAALLEVATGPGRFTYVLVFALEGTVAINTAGRRRIGDLLAGTFVVDRWTPGGAFVPRERTDAQLDRVVASALLVAFAIVIIAFPE